MNIHSIKRMWINRPAKDQVFHDYHGTNVLAVHEYDDTYCIFFLKGDVISCQVPKLWLSNGWLKKD
jgi:hypothetical protein